MTRGSQILAVAAAAIPLTAAGASLVALGLLATFAAEPAIKLVKWARLLHFRGKLFASAKRTGTTWTEPRMDLETMRLTWVRQAMIAGRWVSVPMSLTPRSMDDQQAREWLGRVGA